VEGRKPLAFQTAGAAKTGCKLSRGDWRLVRQVFVADSPAPLRHGFSASKSMSSYKWSCPDQCWYVHEQRVRRPESDMASGQILRFLIVVGAIVAPQKPIPACA
jgi:hypothetical protein